MAVPPLGFFSDEVHLRKWDTRSSVESGPKDIGYPSR